MVQWELFRELTQTPAAPGFEQGLRRVIRKHLEPLADELVQDRLGSLFGVKRGNGEHPRVMVAGHMDEVAMMITRITEDGFLKFQPLGGWWSQVMLAQRVEVINERSERIPGVIGSVPPHLLDAEARKKPVEIQKMFIDIGARDKDEVESLGIQPGDAAVPVCPYVEMATGKRIMTKAWDNRFGCGMAIELLRELKGTSHPNTVYAGATVLEEVGARGAKTSAQMIEPDVFFAVDAGPAGDTPGIRDGFGKLGKGVVIRIFDRTMVTLPGMREFLLDTAESEGIPYQFFVSQGGTDAGQAHLTGKGVPSAAVGIVARYIHSHASVVDKEDVEAAKQFLVALVKRLDKSALESIRGH
ncbi:peptidase M28 [Polycladomyces abyssicola]|uniref:Peptidase M28 n=2 Tax=Polycladomyces abyssicola TaxID=1125966 RepID=A0A8D5ZP08_9BACL|nr:peptidase M28 [Polycladomyces abyssicola]